MCLLKKNRLEANLDAIRRPRLRMRKRRLFRFSRIIRRRCHDLAFGASLAVFDGNGNLSADLRKVKGGRQPEHGTRERQTANNLRAVAIVVLVTVASFAGAINAAVNVIAFFRISAWEESTLDRHVVEKAWAVCILGNSTSGP
jgi:hypothetical protein